MNNYHIRPTAEADMPAVMAMYDYSRNLMRAADNNTQWVGYPTLDQLRTDMARKASYVVERDSRLAGTFALVTGSEPTYSVIVHGRWLDTATPYATMHRLAKTPDADGIASAAFAYAKQHHAHLRIDTHESNHTLQAISKREGFVYCGIVFLADGTERLAYEWWRWDEVPESLQEWVEQTVLPQYDSFDTAHRRDHARRVIARAMTIYRHQRARLAPPTAPLATMMPEMVYTAAAMHDLGLAQGREEHHLASGSIIRSCNDLQRWFSKSQIEKIAQAAEDHRASASRPPRTRLGDIIAEADRDVEPETIVRRTVEYGLCHYPTLDREGHWRRTLEHLHEKYAEGGYIKLWLPDSPNAKPLAELRDLIHDEARLRELFNQFYNS